MHEEYMRQALDLARQAAACGEVPVGSRPATSQALCDQGLES